MKKILIFFVVLLLLFQSFSFAEEIKTITYYGTSSCISCREISNYFENEIKPKYNVKIDYIDTSENSDMFQKITYAYGKEAVTPTIIINGNMYQGVEEIKENLEREIKSADIPNKSPLITGGNVYEEKFQTMSIPVIIMGALLDGVNPCSIAMLLFFISLLIAMNDKKKILLAGISYISAIFFTYFFIGLGLLKFLTEINGLSNILLIVYGFTIILCVFLFYVDFRDYIHIKKGDFGKVKNELPKGIRHKIQNILREKTNSKYLYLTTFFAGVVVSLLEFSCTGQVYIPTLTFILSQGEAKALLLLLMYNVFFILPIVIVLIAAYKTNSIIETSMKLIQHRDKIKLASLVFYFLIIAYFSYKLFQILV